MMLGSFRLSGLGTSPGLLAVERFLPQFLCMEPIFSHLLRVT